MFKSEDIAFLNDNFEDVRRQLNTILNEKGDKIAQDRIEKCVKQVYKQTNSMLFAIRIYVTLRDCSVTLAKIAVERILKFSV